MTNTIKAERATIRFFEGLEVDGYRMPDGQFRVGITKASVAVGFADNYLRRLISDGGTRLQPLQRLGFTAETISQVRDTRAGEREERTISLEDFARLIRFADRQNKVSAGAILDALVKVSLIDFFRDGFGEKPLTVEEKRAALYSTYAKAVNWMEEEKEEKLDLALGMAQWH